MHRSAAALCRPGEGHFHAASFHLGELRLLGLDAVSVPWWLLQVIKKAPYFME